MNKPNAYDEVKSENSKESVTLGGHYSVIKQVKEAKSKNGKDMIIVAFDFDFPDQQDGYFFKLFSEDTREDKKWPFQGRKYIMVNDWADASKVSKAFASFCNAVEKSNPGFDISWGDDWGKQFTNKKIGTVFGLEENEYNGNTFMRPTIKWFCAIDKVESAAIPEPKYLKAKEEAPMTEDKGFKELEDDVELPF